MAEAREVSGGLVKGLGLFDATTIVMGSMIGSGIFIVSADIARQVAKPRLADHDLGGHGGAHRDRRAQLRRAGRHDAAGGRAVRLPARGVRPAERIPLRLDAVPGDPDRHDRGRGRGVRQVHGRVLPGHLGRPVPAAAGRVRRQHAATAGDRGAGAADLGEHAGRPHRRHGAEHFHRREDGRAARPGRTRVLRGARHAGRRRPTSATSGRTPTGAWPPSGWWASPWWARCSPPTPGTT